MNKIALEPRKYVVRPGDNLDKIARDNGYRDWTVIYKSKCNERLRATRPNASLIKPGDIVMLPPRPADIRVSLQTRLQQLRSIRLQTDSLFAAIQSDLESEFKKVEQTGSGVDIISDVLGIVSSLSKLCWNGYKTLDMGARELAEANKELAKEALDIPKDQLKDLTLKVVADNLDEPQSVLVHNSVWVFSEIVIRSWLDITSPSYWAGVFVELRSGSTVRTAVTRRPSDIFKDTSAKLAQTRRQALGQIDSKLRETERLLSLLNAPIGVPLPMR